MTGIEQIARERERQFNVEAFTDASDDRHHRSEMAMAAASYTAHAIAQINRLPTELVPRLWPWDRESWRPSPNPARNLVKAGALIAAELDRLARAKIEPDPGNWEHRGCHHG